MERILKLIENYRAEYQRARKEYNKATKGIYKKYASGKLQAYRRMVDDLSALAELSERDQANELLPLVSNSVCEHKNITVNDWHDGYATCDECGQLVQTDC